VQADVLSALDQIIILLRERSGNDFSLYKTNTLYRRIERRMAVHQLATMKDYVRHLRGNLQENDLLFKELLIGVTSFFRDAEVWEALRSESIPALLAKHPEGKALRAWVAACSTGEEAYSLAIVFKEAWKTPARGALHAADLRHRPRPRRHRPGAQGLYPDNIAADVSPERLARHFVAEEGGGYRIARTSAKWWCSRRRTSPAIRPSPSSTS
jgi:two-component system CheB/CheR fusion protein